MGGAFAQINITSANGHPWDLNNNTGSVEDGGRDAFDTFGFLGLRVSDSQNVLIAQTNQILGFTLTTNLSNSRLVETSTPVTFSGVTISRQLFMPPGTDFIRYIDTFLNTTQTALKIQVAFQGNLGSDGATLLRATSSGDLVFDAADAWGVTTEGTAVGDPVVGMLAGNIHLSAIAHGAFSGTSPFDSIWPGNGADDLSFVYALDLAPGASVSTAFFVYRGLSETSGAPGTGLLPGVGSQVPAAVAALNAMLANPDFSLLSTQQIGQIANFTAVPEPSMWALLASGGGMLLIGAWRRRRI